jgi:poly [ADP-ribose] polymerase
VDTKTDRRKNRYPISIREVGEPTSYHEKNILVTKNVDFVPVDLYFSKRDEARVLFYQKAFYSITLSQSNLAKDDNKFFIIQVLLLGESPEEDNYYLFTRWGRVGVVGQKS